MPGSLSPWHYPRPWPPPWVFWLVWIVIYPTWGFATYLVWQKRQESDVRGAIALFVLMFVSGLFFMPVASLSGHNPGVFVTLRRYRDLSEAIVARSLLESAGIPAYLRDENLIRLDWPMSNVIGGIRLQVDASDEQSATEFLAQPIPDSIPFDDQAEFLQPQCPQCQSTDITFEGSSRKAALVGLYIASLPLPLGSKTWLCGNCCARWEDAEENNQV